MPLQEKWWLHQSLMADTVADEIRQESSFGAEWQLPDTTSGSNAGAGLRKWQEHMERTAQNGAAYG